MVVRTYNFFIITLIFSVIITQNLKQFNKFGIARKPRPTGILQLKIFWKKEESKLKKMKMKNFLCK